MNKSELSAIRWLEKNKKLKREDIHKQKGTPDFLTPLGGFEVKKVYGNKVIFYGNQLEKLTRFPEVKVLLFNGSEEFVKEVPVSDIDRSKGAIGEYQIVEPDLASIPVSQSNRDRLKGLGKMGESYDAVISRLLSKEKTEEPPGDV